MRQKTKLFFLGILLFCLIVPIPVLFINRSVALQPPQMTNYYELNSTLDLCAVRLAMEMDSKYEPLEFSSDVPESVKKEIRSDFYSYLNNHTSGILKNPAIMYQATYKRQSLAQGDLNSYGELGKALFWYDIQVRRNDTVQIEGFNGIASLNDVLTNMDGYTYYGSNYKDKETGQYYSSDYLGTIYDLATLNLPEGFRVQFVIDQAPSIIGLAHNSLAPYFDYEEALLAYPFIVLAISTFLLALIILLVPFKVEKEAYVFNEVLKFKAFSALFIGTIGLTGLISLLVVVSSATFSGKLIEILQTGMIPMAQPLAWFVNYSLWALSLFFIALCCFYIKSVFSRGFIRYIKEETITYQLYQTGKKELKNLTTLDMKDPFNKRLRRLVIANGVVVFLFMFIPVVSNSLWTAIVFIVIYGLCLFKWLRKKATQIKTDYQKTLHAAQLLADGKFKEVQPQPVGIMMPIYQQLLNIRPGFEKAVAEAIASQNMKNQLLSNVSHDLKTPLTGIKNYSELIEQSQDVNEIKTYAGKLSSYCDRLDRLIVDLFDVSKADSGTIKPEYMPVSLKNLIDEIQYEHEENFTARQLSIVKNLPEQEVILQLDPNRTMRIFDNLFSNIEKYAMEGTRVFITMEELPDEVIVVVKNMSKFPLDFDSRKITDRFERGDSSRHESGSGLGLAIVRSFLELQNGRFEIQMDADLFKAILHFTKLPQLPEV